MARLKSLYSRRGLVRNISGMYIDFPFEKMWEAVEEVDEQLGFYSRRGLVRNISGSSVFNATRFNKV